ncbi:MAG: hypothetical protein ABW133_19260 [Polyangiaceae bacterium]
MSRKLMAVLVSTALAFGNVTTSAWAAGEPAKAAQTSIATKNQSPLPAAGAAGIKQAQGAGDNSALILGGLIVGSIVLALLLTQDDDDDSGGPPSGTN